MKPKERSEQIKRTNEAIRRCRKGFIIQRAFNQCQDGRKPAGVSFEQMMADLMRGWV